MTKLEDSIKAKLNIKYSAAKQLIAEAKANLEITDEGLERQDEILDEAAQIFEDDLLPDEQEAMRVSGEVKSDWKQRAAAAQRREMAQQHAEQPPEQQPEEEEVVEEDVVEEYEEPAEDVDQPEEVVEEVVEEEGEGDDDAGGETITETVTTQVGEDGTQTVTKKTVKKTVTEESGGTKVVLCCTIL